MSNQSKIHDWIMANARSGDRVSDGGRKWLVGFYSKHSSYFAFTALFESFIRVSSSDINFANPKVWRHCEVPPSSNYGYTEQWTCIAEYKEEDPDKDLYPLLEEAKRILDAGSYCSDNLYIALRIMRILREARKLGEEK